MFYLEVLSKVEDNVDMMAVIHVGDDEHVPGLDPSRF
jgi:hypothetical protein